MAIDEDDGKLPYPEPPFDTAIIDLDLKGVAIGPD
jgi:hypothetical protein